MRLLTQKAEIKYSVIVFVGLFFLISLLFILYWFDIVADPKWGAIISGLLTGLLVSAFQIWLSWNELVKLDEFHSMKIINILPRRDDREHYEKLMSVAKQNIWLQGVTAQRFLEHFASADNSRDGAQVLLAALGKGVKVRILVASPKNLTDPKQRNKADIAEVRLRELKNKFANFDYGYFEHEPAHVIFIVDEECIVGPVFPGVSSEVTPAIHLKNDSEFVQKYLDYFEDEWKKWGANKSTS